MRLLSTSLISCFLRHTFLWLVSRRNRRFSKESKNRCLKWNFPWTSCFSNLSPGFIPYQLSQFKASFSSEQNEVQQTFGNESASKDFRAFNCGQALINDFAKFSPQTRISSRSTYASCDWSMLQATKVNEISWVFFMMLSLEKWKIILSPLTPSSWKRQFLPVWCDYGGNYLCKFVNFTSPGNIAGIWKGSRNEPFTSHTWVGTALKVLTIKYIYMGLRFRFSLETCQRAHPTNSFETGYPALGSCFHLQIRLHSFYDAKKAKIIDKMENYRRNKIVMQRRA